jgi:hypothetical protein
MFSFPYHVSFDAKRWHARIFFAIFICVQSTERKWSFNSLICKVFIFYEWPLQKYTLVLLQRIVDKEIQTLNGISLYIFLDKIFFH